LLALFFFAVAFEGFFDVGFATFTGPSKKDIAPTVHWYSHAWHSMQAERFFGTDTGPLAFSTMAKTPAGHISAQVLQPVHLPESTIILAIYPPLKQ